VRNLSGRERYSQPFFFDPSLDTIVECPPQLLAAGEAPKHPPVRYGDYVMERLDKNYAYRQQQKAV
jgi:isopenicillin N synthase-like dioxygenase